MQLELEEARVLGALVEKELTTPDQYPLTLNALVAACNQSSNREPVVRYDVGTVEATLVTLKDRGLLRWVYPSHGRSVTRYRHVLDEATGMDGRQLSLVAVLMLRGPLTSGELRARTDRMTSFDSVDEVERELEVLGRGEAPFVTRLPHRPGQREARYAHLLCGPATDAPVVADAVVRGGQPSMAERVSALEKEVEALRRDLDELVTGRREGNL